MTKYLYRYVSFETFVGMVQNQALTFVSPTMWEDPKESAPFRALVENTEDVYEKAMLYCLMQKTYCQSWTEVAESDAMWRIYSFNNRALQIKVDVEKLSQLDAVAMKPVEYTNDMQIIRNEVKDAFLRSLAIKRCAFEHEKETRLIKYHVFNGWEDLEKHIKAFLIINEHPQMIEILESMYPGLSVEEQTLKTIELLNIGKHRINTLDVPFDGIPDFISGVKIHPMAPAWYVEIVKEYCKRNSIPFTGQSTLYSKE